ncbi:MAG: afsK [Acidobacteria bacterium]|nr:afsK [Acidobacteriota bacterium]
MPTRRAALAPLLALCLPVLAAAQGVPPAVPVGPPAQPPPGAAAPAQPALTLYSAWSTELPAAPSGPPAFDAQYGFVPLRNGELAAVALDRGTLAWAAPVEARAVAAGIGLVFLAGAESIEARAAATGARGWAYAAGEALAPVLFFDGGWLLAATAAGDALMLNAQSGALLWRQPLGAALGRQAVMTGDRVYLLLDDGRVTARRLADGSMIWERKLGGRPTALRALDDRVFVGAEDKYLYCLDASDGDQHWRWRAGGGVTGTPAVDAGRLYFVAFDNVLRALNRGNGHLRWMRPLGFRPSDGPVLLGELLLVPTVSPDLALFRADTGAPAGKVSAGAEPAAAPHVLPGAATAADMVLLVVTREGSIERLGPPPPPLLAKPLPGVPPYVSLAPTVP